MKEGRKSGVGYPTIISVEVTGGWLKGFRVELAPGFVVVIGSNGAGKTTLLELIRFALGDERVTPPTPRGVKTPLQKRLGEGSVVVRIRTAGGVNYSIQRSWNEKLQVIDEKDQALSVDLAKDLGFKVDAYGHHEIQAIAVSPELQLGILDKVEEAQTRSIEDDIRSVLRDLEESAAKVLLLDKGADDLRTTAAKLDGARDTLEKLGTPGADGDLLREAHAKKAQREKERELLETLPAYLRKARVDLESNASGIARRLEGWIDADSLGGANQEVLSPFARQLQELSTRLDQTSAELTLLMTTAEASSAERAKALSDRHAKQEADYRALVNKSEEETGRARERAEAFRRHAAATDAVRELVVRNGEREKRRAKRDVMLSRLWDLRERRSQLRRDTAALLTERLKGRVRFTVKPEEDRQLYRQRLEEAFKGRRIKGVGDVVEKLVKHVTREELVKHVERDAADALAGQADIDRPEAQRVIDELRETEALYEIESTEIGDVPRIELRDEDGQYKDSGDLSMGERCAAVLPLLLVSNDQPLLVDEPEGSLNQFFLSETLARSLVDVAGTRQYLFASHNAIIPVVGCADLVIFLEGNSEKSGIKKAGTVDELRKEIEKSCDGGRDAFRERQRLYEKR